MAAWDGEVDMANARLLEQETIAALQNTDAGLTVDLSGVRYIDSAGSRSLLMIGRLLQQRQQELLLVIPEDSLINKALQIGGVRSVIPVYTSLDAAQQR